MVSTARRYHATPLRPLDAGRCARGCPGGPDRGYAQLPLRLAGERSLDAQSGAAGGELGCGPAGQYVQPFDEAVFSQPVGEVGEPVETEFGFHVILVTDRSTPTFEDVRPDVEAALAQDVETAFGEWFTGALESTDVTVDVGARTARAVIALAPSDSTGASFEIGDMTITAVGDGAGPLNFQDTGDQLDVGVPAIESCQICGS